MRIQCQIQCDLASNNELDMYYNPFGYDLYGMEDENATDELFPEITQADRLYSQKLQNALSATRSMEASGELLPHEASKAKYTIQRMLDPLLAAENDRKQREKQQAIQDAHQAAAQQAAFQQQNAEFRAGRFADRVSYVTIPGSGKPLAFYESEPGKWTQVKDQPAPSGDEDIESATMDFLGKSQASSSPPAPPIPESIDGNAHTMTVINGDRQEVYRFNKDKDGRWMPAAKIFDNRPSPGGADGANPPVFPTQSQIAEVDRFVANYFRGRPMSHGIQRQMDAMRENMVSTITANNIRRRQLSESRSYDEKQWQRNVDRLREDASARVEESRRKEEQSAMDAQQREKKMDRERAIRTYNSYFRQEREKFLGDPTPDEMRNAKMRSLSFTRELYPDFTLESLNEKQPDHADSGEKAKAPKAAAGMSEKKQSRAAELEDMLRSNAASQSRPAEITDEMAKKISGVIHDDVEELQRGWENVEKAGRAFALGGYGTVIQNAMSAIKNASKEKRPLTIGERILAERAADMLQDEDRMLVHPGLVIKRRKKAQEEIKKEYGW